MLPYSPQFNFSNLDALRSMLYRGPQAVNPGGPARPVGMYGNPNPAPVADPMRPVMPGAGQPGFDQLPGGIQPTWGAHPQFPTIPGGVEPPLTQPTFGSNPPMANLAALRSLAPRY